MTHDQLARIDKMPEECRVIGMERLGNPVISYPHTWSFDQGQKKVVVVDHTGRLRAASMRVRLELAKRRIDRAAA